MFGGKSGGTTPQICPNSGGRGGAEGGCGSFWSRLYFAFPRWIGSNRTFLRAAGGATTCSGSAISSSPVLGKAEEGQQNSKAASVTEQDMHGTIGAICDSRQGAPRMSFPSLNTLGPPLSDLSRKRPATVQKIAVLGEHKSWSNATCLLNECNCCFSCFRTRNHDKQLTTTVTVNSEKSKQIHWYDSTIIV